MRRQLLLYILMLSVALQAFAGEATERFLSRTGLDPDRVSILIEELPSGKVLESHNTETPLIPASIMKSVTIATLIDKTGPDMRYSTKVYLTAPVRKGVVDGNIVVVGSGDPSLNSTCEPQSADFVREIVDALKKRKVTEIKGRIVVNGDVFSGPDIPPTWAKGDLPHSYGTGTHGFNFENNASGKRSVSNPTAVFETRLRRALTDAGISLGGESLQEGERTEILDHLSPTVDEIMRSCMMRSDNMMAESLLRTYSVERGGDGSTSDAAEAEARFWKSRKAPMDGVVIVDGSGLSRSNRVTGEFMAYVLREMSGDPVYASFFPLAGQEGTLRRFLADTPLDSYIAMKTGSMSGIQCYAGYKLDDDYAPTHVVVVIINGMNMSRDKVRSALQELLLTVFE